MMKSSLVSSMRCALCMLLLLGALPACAQSPSASKPIALSKTGQPTNYLLVGKLYRATGYGRATFGMTPQQVQAIVADDFPQATTPVQDSRNPAGRLVGLTIVVPSLAPGVGPATMTYVFGTQNQRLIAINIYWLVAGHATAHQQSQIIESAATLASSFVGYLWLPFQSVRGLVAANGSLIVFSGKDEKGGGVEVRLDGVPYDVQTFSSGRPVSANPTRYEPPLGPAQLSLSIVANVDGSASEAQVAQLPQ
jgi:hypothetical protein